jgi:nucleoside-diphosphate-sugar epimerase
LRILVIGGTRNLGHQLVLELLAAGHGVCVCNRGVTPDELPPDVERLRADRRDAPTLACTLGGRSFDAVVDTTLYDGPDASAIAELLDGRTGHYVFVSSGQVYLVRPGLARPFVEEDYEGAIMAAPPEGTPDFEEWRYGVDKRAAEDVLISAWETRRFPFTSLRLPMVNGERDHYRRIAGYLARLRDGAPIVIPAEGQLALRHVDGADVVQAIVRLLGTGPGAGRAYNISQDETVTLEEFLELLSGLAGRPIRVARVARKVLESNRLLPGCSPFSNRWMSELDNRKSKAELGVRYTLFARTVERVVRHYEQHGSPLPESYARRADELALAG